MKGDEKNIMLIICPNCGSINNLREISGLQCNKCDYIFNQQDLERAIESGLQKEVNEKVKDDKKINRKCIPVLKTEGWIFWCLHTLTWKFPKEVLKYLEIILIKLWKLEIYINWCIVASIFRIVSVIGFPILIIYTGTLIRFDSHQHFNEAIGLMLGIIFLGIVWLWVLIWLSESHNPDVILVRKMILYGGKKEE